MGNRIITYTGYLLLAVFVALNLVLGYFGISSVFLTVIVYGLVWLAGAGAIKLFFKNSDSRKNYLLLLTTLTVCLLSGEFALRYVFKVGLERQEMNGNFFYSFPYGKPAAVENFLRKFTHKEQDLKLRNYEPYTSMLKGKGEFQYFHTYNSLGLRGREPSRDSLKINIVGLGDSYTEGSGTPEDSTWLELLKENMSEQDLAMRRKVNCLNGGIAGSDPFEEYLILQNLLLPYKPRVVILAINTTDISDVLKSGGGERFEGYKQVPWWAYIYQFSFIARNIIHKVHPVNWLFLTDQQYREEEKRAIEKIEHLIINDYQKTAEKNNFKLIVVLHPMLFELEQDRFSLQPLAEKLKAAEAIQTVNLFEAFKNARKKTGLDYKSLFWQIDGHNNPTGYKLWADSLIAPTQTGLKGVLLFTY